MVTRRRISGLDRKLLRDLWRLKGQGLAIAIVVGAGIALLVATFGCLAALKSSRDAFYERYRFADVFAPLKRAPDSLIDRLRLIDGVAEIETRIVAEVTLDLADLPEPAIGRLISIPESGRPLLNDIELKSGRLISASRAEEVIVSEAFAKAHRFMPGDTLAAIVNGKRRTLTIVGVALTPEYVYSLAPGQFMPDDLRFGVLWMGRKALAAAFDLDQAFNNVAATLQYGARKKDVIARLDDTLRIYGGIGAYDRTDQISDFFLSNELVQLESMGTIAPPIFLAVAAFLLNIVLTRLLATEREQIGVLKAFGYGDAAIAWHYAKMMLALMALGLVFGLLSGVWLGRSMTHLYEAYFRFPLLTYRVDPRVFLLAAAISVLAGLVGGFGTVRQAARLAPAVAMAPPIPAAYRHSPFGKIFCRVNVSQPTQMIFRHLMRWPLRTWLGVIGIGASVAILVASLFFMDTVNRVIEVVFFQAERQTLTIGFVEPRPANVEQRIRGLPGVVATEPVRSVAVRLRHGQYSKRMALNGIVPQADLGRLLDTDIRPVDPPAGGIAVSRRVAEQLRLGLGDAVTVEVMQERRPVRDVPVTRIIEEYMGFGSYMTIDALNGLMREGPAVSGIRVLADARRVDDLYRTVKGLPGVAGVALTNAALTGFRTTMANTMYVMVGFYIAFAALIAIGVSYNSARVAFSERARSLASLRVLGFTNAETAYILLGELALQTAVALPLGCAMGYGLAWVMSPMLTTDMYSFPMVIARSTYGIAMLVVGVSAIICGAMITRRVYRLDLVSVLKTRD